MSLAKADLRLCWSHIPHCWKAHVTAQLCQSAEHSYHVSCSNVILFQGQNICYKQNYNKPLSIIKMQNILIRQNHRLAHNTTKKKDTDLGLLISRYLDDLFNIDNMYLERMASQIYPTELLKSYIKHFHTEALNLDLALRIKGEVSTVKLVKALQ